MFGLQASRGKIYYVYMLTPEQVNQIRAVCEPLPIEVLYLFGSQALDRVGPMSDYDFAVLFAESVDSGTRFDLKLDLASQLSRIVKARDVDVVDLNSAPITFRYSAVKLRRDLFTRNPDVRFAFEFDTITKLRDYYYYYHRDSLATIERIAQFGLS